MGSTIESGTDFSHYRVIGPIGAGGMGEVYKAHDTKLERTIALKILPPGLVKNEERLRRFMQEARSASSLNHPHIVTIHEIGETTISSSDAPTETENRSIHYIAMELVDGLTLKRKIHEERADLRSLLGYMAQAADGLAKAHSAGIVHRDLKPENIMVTRDGFAKVLDFGLAKLHVKKGVTEATLSEATEIRDETREGAILGTVAYMSPEQVQGKVVDHRSDIFSFGAILYEAATRRRPFEADSDVDVMHKIMHDKPVPIDEIDATVPTEVRRMIRRCLAKDPDRRYQSMKDLSIELRELVDEYDELSASAASRSSGSLSQSVVAVSPQRRRVIWAGASLIALLAVASVGFGVYQWRQARTTRSTPAQFAAMKMQRLTTTGDLRGIAISPDGKYLAYAKVDEQGDHALFVRQIATGSDVQIAEPGTSFSGGTFSPDGTYIYYSRREANVSPFYSWLHQVPVLGGSSRKLLFDVDTNVSFSPDGKQVVFGRGLVGSDENHYIIANVDGSGERKLAALARLRGSPVGPAWSPDGRRIATAVGVPPVGMDMKLVEIELETGAVRDLGTTKWWEVGTVSWKPDGSGLFFIAVHPDSGRSQLWFQPYPSGEPVRITNDLNDYRLVSFTADGGTAVALQADDTSSLTIGEYSDPSGGKPLPTDNRRRAWQVSSSAAGPIVFQLSDETAVDIAILDSPEARPRMITNDGRSFSPSISADGKTIVYVAEGGNTQPHVYVTNSEGSTRRQLTNGEGEFNAQISPDGSTVIYTSGSSLWRIPVSGGTAVKINDDASMSSGSAHTASISRDSMRIAYLYLRHDAGGPRQYLRVQPLAGGPPILDRPWNRIGRMRWTHDDAALTYSWRQSGRGVNLFLQSLDDSESKQLTQYTTGFINSFDWTADGRLVIIRGESRADAVLITGLE